MAASKSGTDLSPVFDAGRRHEVLGIVSAAVTLVLVLALLSFDATSEINWIGPAGHWTTSLLGTAFGFGAWVIPLELALVTVRLFRRQKNRLGAAMVASTMVLLLVGCSLLHLSLSGVVGAFGANLPGGLLGELLGELLRSVFGNVGSFVVTVATMLVTVVLRTSLSIIDLTQTAAVATKSASGSVYEFGKRLWLSWREARDIELRDEAKQRKLLEPRVKGKRRKQEDEEESLSEDDDVRPALVEFPAGSGRRKRLTAADLETAPTTPGDEEAPEAESEDDLESAPLKAKASRTKGQGPVVVAASYQTPKPKRVIVQPEAVGEFQLPPMSLLEAPNAQRVRIDERTLKENAAKLCEKLVAYGVQGRVDEIHPGPVVTMYEFEPASGTKVSKISSLSDDLAMVMAAQKVRIVAPIPGKARVGFELPNADRESVALREILEDERWNTMKGALPFALGKDIAGQPVYGDLAKMPHLLVAGATGAGKSVGLNVMLVSLLAKKTPEEVRLLMIDPKVVELAVFDGIPHMLLPVVTDMKKAARALRWAVDEMERRYQLFADAGARNITSYNERVDKVLRGEMPIEKLAPHRVNKVRAQGPDGEEVLLPPDGDEAPDALDQKLQKLPYVVVVVDEFADLMMVAAKDVETAVARLAQKARAAGIHVILATQRPSVDVITGMIKANFPSRIAFKVSQREDSKTILGRSGAEHLLGMGDMLMLPPGSSDLKRVHCAFISEDDVKSVCDYLREQGTPVYDENIIKPREDEEDEEGGGGGGKNTGDPVYDRAVAIVAQAGYCSISHLQRQLGLGYNKAAKLVEQMENEGVVGPASNKAGGRREVLIQPYS